jgi:hypothetical protein
LNRRATDRKAGDPDFLNTEELGEREQTLTAVATASYMAVYIRHTVPTSALLQEVVLVLSPTQPVRDAFIFVAGISRQPTQLDNWAGKSPRPPIDSLEDHVDHRNQVRSIATDRLVVDSTGQVVSQPEEMPAGQFETPRKQSGKRSAVPPVFGLLGFQGFMGGGAGKGGTV